MIFHFLLLRNEAIIIGGQYAVLRSFYSYDNCDGIHGDGGGEAGKE